MNADKRQDDEIIELTEVLDEDDHFDEQHMDEEFENFLAADEPESSREDSPPEGQKAGGTDPDFDSLFEQDETDELDQDWTLEEDGDAREHDFQEIESLEEQEDSEETEQLETLLAGLDEPPLDRPRQDAAGDQSQVLRSELDKIAHDLQEVQHKLSAYPAADSLQSLLEDRAEPEARNLSHEVEEALLQKALDRCEKTLEKKMEALQQEFAEKLTRSEQTIQAQFEETLDKKISSIREESAAKIEELASRLAEQDASRQQGLQDLKNELPSHTDLEELQSEMKNQMKSQIQKTVPQTAARVIREEIRKLQQD